jgi:hypothetical protein
MREESLVERAKFNAYRRRHGYLHRFAIHHHRCVIRHRWNDLRRTIRGCWNRDCCWRGCRCRCDLSR